MVLSTGSVVGSGAMIVVGGVVAAVTVIGLVSNQVNSPAKDAANSSNPSISYGTVDQ
jgi:hypothetical protein